VQIQWAEWPPSALYFGAIREISGVNPWGYMDMLNSPSVYPNRRRNVATRRFSQQLLVTNNVLHFTFTGPWWDAAGESVQTRWAEWPPSALYRFYDERD